MRMALCSSLKERFIIAAIIVRIIILKLDSFFTLFFEKVYLHLDRTYYSSGDDIWFKAYLVNGQNNRPINTSNNLYVELIGPNASIVSRIIVRLDSAVGYGDFKLDDSVTPGPY